MIAVVSQNIPQVNASSANYNSANLKFITKNIPGYGNVTAREDMFIVSGNNTSIVMNKDYKERGVITPIIEDPSPVNYVNVSTPYGIVQVSPETYKMLGAANICANYKVFLDQRNESTNVRNSTPGATNINTANYDLQSIIVPGVKTYSNSLSPMSSTSVRDELWFTQKNGLQAHYLSGQITPSPGNPLPPAGYTSYHEYEVYLNQNGDVVEFISDHRSNEISVWVALYDNYNWVTATMPSFDNVNGPIQYYFNYNRAGNYYDLFLYNPGTNQAREDTYRDPDTSTYIGCIGADVELWYTTIGPNWYDRTVMEQWIAQVGTINYNPTDVFNMGTVTPIKYASVSGTSSNGHYITTHQDGLNVD